MAAPAGTVVRTAVLRRSPGVAAALDVGQATVRARRWADRAMPGAVVDAVRVGSVLYRPDGGCALRYTVRLGPAPLSRERVLLVDVPSSGAPMRIRPFPGDPALPTLHLAVDPVLMREVLGRVVPGTGGERAVGRCAVDVVRHSRRGRCVLRYRLSIGAGGPGELRHPVVFGKVHADSTAAASASAARILRHALRRMPDGLRIDVPRPLAVVAPLSLGLTEAVAGRPLLPGLVTTSCERGLSAAGTPALTQAVRTAARAAAAMHLAAPSGAALPVRDLDGERAATERELAQLEGVWPDVAEELRRGAARAPASSRGQPAPVLSHGDFTPGQLLLDDGRAGIVDLDTLCLAEPALDLGRFLAYLHVAGFRRSRDCWPLLADLSALFLESYLEVCASSSGNPSTDARRLLLARVADWRASVLARLGVSACWQLKDDRLGAVLDVLGAGDDWMGRPRG